MEAKFYIVVFSSLAVFGLMVIPYFVIEWIFILPVLKRIAKERLEKEKQEAVYKTVSQQLAAAGVKLPEAPASDFCGFCGGPLSVPGDTMIVEGLGRVHKGCLLSQLNKSKPAASSEPVIFPAREPEIGPDAASVETVLQQLEKEKELLEGGEASFLSEDPIAQLREVNQKILRVKEDNNLPID